MADAVTKMREICAKLADVSERAHFGDRMFYVGKKPFASAGDGNIVVGLEPEHIDALLEAEPATYSRYPRAKNALLIDTSTIKKWGAVKDLVLESYRRVAEAKRTASAKKAGAKPTARKRSR